MTNTKMIQTESEYYELLKIADEKKLMGQHDEAIEVCESILLDDLECVEAYEEIGDNYLRLREFEKAIRALSKAAELNPFSPNAHYLLGFTYSAISDWESSIKELELADQFEPNHPEILRCLGWSIFHSGRKTQGLVILERAAFMAQDDTLILSDLGVCYLNYKEFEKAAGVFSTVLDLEPDNEKAHECLKACQYFNERLG